MSHQVEWSKIILETFIAEGCLTHEEEMVMRTRVAGWTRTVQAMEFGWSIEKVDKIIARCKKKYDNAQRYNPILPPRKTSEKETYMDEH